MFLDLDGVLNVVRNAWHEPPRRDYVLAGNEFLKLSWSPTLVRRLVKLSERVDIVWCTSWCGYTREVELKMRLPEFRDALTREQAAGAGGLSRNEWKFLAVAQAAATGRPVIWVDDEAIPTFGQQLDLLEEKNVLLVRPLERSGLTPLHMQMIEAYVTSIRYTPL
jgi:hypothetical protein